MVHRPTGSGIERQVQRNCDIADARHGADFGMCTYLLKMREYYRWEQKLPLDMPLSKDQVGDWLVEREQRWESLAGADFQPLVFEGKQFDPFDSHGLNQLLERRGLVYSGGLALGGRPQFFLAELAQVEHRPDAFSLHVAGRELARGLSAPPAMQCGRDIFVRREAMRQLLWEKYESWRWSQVDNAMGRAFACYPIEQQPEQALEQMVEAELPMLRDHEVGEYLAGELLGDDWNRMLLDLAMTPAELAARAVRDHLADCLSTLPQLLARQQQASLHFYVGNLGAMRKQLFPALLDGYQHWLDGGHDWQLLGRLIDDWAAHWRSLAGEMLDIHAHQGEQAAAAIYRHAQQRVL